MSGQTFSQTTTDGNRSTKRIWRVERLWGLSIDLPVKTVPLSSISALDEVTWFDTDQDSRPTGRRVADHAKRIYEADLDLPVILSAEGWVMDGMHRVCRAYVLGLETINAVQFVQNPEADETTETQSA